MRSLTAAVSTASGRTPSDGGGGGGSTGRGKGGRCRGSGGSPSVRCTRAELSQDLGGDLGAAPRSGSGLDGAEDGAAAVAIKARVYRRGANPRWHGSAEAVGGEVRCLASAGPSEAQRAL